jgi:signal transduction histidine kinase
MGWRTPSLTKRLVAGFMVSLVLMSLALVALVAAITPEHHMASEHGAALVQEELQRTPDGGLRLKPGGKTAELAARSPQMWFLASDGEHELTYGKPPADARQVFPVLVGFYLFASAVIMAAPILVVLAVVVLLILRPIVLKGLRPLAAAASRLDGADPAMRLPEEGVMSELLPLVRALNSALDRLEQAFEGRRRFMADVAHEFRTPLAVLTMHADELPEGRTRADLQRGLFRMSQMVGQMLDSERLGRPGRREPVDLAAVARGATADIAPLALEAGYQLEFAADAERVLVEGDAHAIKRAVTNLLGNAVAHAGGSGAIRVRVGADAVVEVADEGAGVSKEARERVFEPFHRERWDRDGCGLGLHLVREIMRAHGGRAELADYGTGAIFRLVVPRPGAAQEALQ